MSGNDANDDILGIIFGIILEYCNIICNENAVPSLLLQVILNQILFLDSFLQTVRDI